MIEAWRISKSADAQQAFSGEGARLWGGRWNRKGVAVVYTAAYRSLALLEVLVHIKNAQQSQSPLNGYVMFPVVFDEELLEELPMSSLLADWDAEPPRDSTKLTGDAWVSGASSSVLSVPSVVVDAERNYLLNPNHNLFSRIQIGSPVPCKFDPRLL